jgi:Isochorismatase family
MVDYDQSTALVVVDVQNDFADPKGSLYVGEGERVVPLVNRELERALAADALVVYTQDWHPAQTPHFESGGGVWPEHCIQGSWGANRSGGLLAGWRPAVSTISTNSILPVAHPSEQFRAVADASTAGPAEVAGILP